MHDADTDVELGPVTASTNGSELGKPWMGGGFALQYMGTWGGSGGSLSLEFSRRIDEGFTPVTLDLEDGTAFAATGPGIVRGWLPRGYVRVQFSDAEAEVTDVTVYIRSERMVITVERA